MAEIWEVLDRAVNSGPVMSSNDFDMRVFETASRLAEEYDIRYDPENPVPSDDTLLEDIFQAGVELYLETGTYCMNTGRIVKFSEEEIKQALREVPSELEIGEGAERRRLFQRKAEDTRAPLYLGGVIESNPQEGEIFVKLYQTIAREKLVDGIYFGPPHTIEGKTARFGSPIEAHAHRCAAMWVREALRRAGRPGLHLISASPSAIGDMTACDPENGVRRSDCIALPVTSELKTDYDQLMKVVYSLEYGCTRNPYWTPIIGGFAGGPNTAAIVSVADALHAVLVYQVGVSGYVLVSGHFHAIPGSSPRATIWLRNVVIQVLQSETPIIVGGCQMSSAGPGTEQMFWEIVGATVAQVAAGGHIMHGTRKAKLVKPNQGSGLEVKFQAEVAKAAAGMRRSEANEIVKELLKKYEDKLEPEKAPPGHSFEEIYDLKTLMPRKEFLEVYWKVKSELRDMGLELESF